MTDDKNKKAQDAPYTDAPPQAAVNEDAPHPETSEHAPETDTHDEEEQHNAPHADNYDRLVGARNDAKDKKKD